MAAEPVRVAQIIGIACAGGVESVIMNYYNNIDRSKYQFDFFVESTSSIIDQKKIESMGGKVIIIPSYKHIFKYQKTLKNIFQDNKYQIVHSNMNTLSVFPLKSAKKAGVKVRIAQAHSANATMKEFLKTLLKYVLRPYSKVNANYYLSCSKKAGMWQFGKKTFNKNLVEVLPCGIQLENFKFNSKYRNEIRKQYDISDDTLVIGHVGRFATVKNHLYLLDIFNSLKLKQPNSKLMLVGDGPLKDDIVNHAKELGVFDDIIFVGLTSEPYKFYNVMDVFLLPSLYEGYGLVAVEAQANGLPTILSDIVSEEVKIDDSASFISVKEKPDVWVEKILSLDLSVGRDKTYEKMLNSPLNIKHSTKILENLYDKYLKEQYVR